MARLHTDGFEIRNINPFDGGYNGTITYLTAPRRSGAYALGLSASDNNWGVILLPGQAAEFYVRAALAHKTDSGRYSYLILRDQNANPLASVQVQGGGANGIRFYVGAALVGAVDFAVVSEQMYLVEVYVRIGDSAAGHFTARVDGTVYVDAAMQTDYGGSTLAALYCHPSRYSPFVMDDLALNDTTGTEHNAWCGSGQVVLLLPDGPGLENWQRSGGSSNYEQVDEVTPDGDATYVYTTGDAVKDEYPVGTVTLPAGHACLLVQPVAVARKVDVEAASLRLGLASDDTEDYDSGRALTTSYALYRGAAYTKDPDTGAAWTQAGLDNVRAGIQSEIP